MVKRSKRFQLWVHHDENGWQQHENTFDAPQEAKGLGWTFRGVDGCLEFRVVDGNEEIQPKNYRLTEPTKRYRKKPVEAPAEAAA